MTPENINSIAGEVDSMINNNGTNPNSSNNPNNFNLGQLLGNILGSLGGENQNNEMMQQTQNQTQNQTQAQQQPQEQEQKKEEQNQEKKESEEKKENTNTNTNVSNNSETSIFKNLVDDAQLRKETKVGDEKKIGETMMPNIEFAEFSNDIVANLTIQEIFDIYNLKFSGFVRLRKDIQSKYFGDKSKNDEIIKTIIELLCERFILIENQLDKLIPGKEFIIEDFFNKEFKKILMMFIDDNEINVSDEKWEEKFRELIIDMLKKLIDELKNIYETGEDGAKTFFEFNIVILIENFIGQKYLDKIQNYDDNLMTNFVDNLFNIIKNEATKKKEETVNDTVNNTANDNIERPTVLSIEEIFKIGNKDKERAEKLKKEEEEKKEENKDEKKDENKDGNKDGKKYSEFYYLTSLFK